MLKLTLLGSPQITLMGEPMSQLTTIKAEALLYYLAITQRTHSRQTLAALLWPNTNEDSARKNLRDALYSLRRRLENYLLISRQQLAFDVTKPYFLDVEHFRKVLSLAPEQLPTATIQATVDLYGGDLLAGFTLRDDEAFEEWLRLEREHLRVLAVRAMHLLAARYLDDANWTAGLEITQRLLILDAYDEATYRQRMRLLAACGQWTTAIAQYEQCRTLLINEVGVEPTLETQMLYNRIRSSQQAALAGSAPLLPYLAPTRSATTPIPVVQTDLQFDDGDLFRHALFLGRRKELEQLTTLLTSQRVRLVTLLGMGGQGKTTLAAALVFHLTQSESPSGLPAKMPMPIPQGFQRILWRSLRNAPPLAELVSSWLKTLLDPATDYQSLSIEQQLLLLLDELKRTRCLLILDNFESILNGGAQTGFYRAGYELYTQLLQRITTYAHQSCLLITSRELPLSYEALESSASVATIHLGGLPATDALQLLQQLSLQSDQATLTTLVNRYSGNPLALKLAAQTIQNLFGGSLITFLQNEALIFGGIRHLLDQQFQRLSVYEIEILLWLAIEREAVAPHVIWESLASQPLRRNFLEALRALQRRSLLEVEETGGGHQPPIRLALPNFWIEYLTDQLVETICHELFTGRMDWFNRFALCKAQTKEYIREVQWRLLVQPVAQRLQAQWRQQTAQYLRALVTQLRTTLPSPPGYSSANLIHLFLQLNLSMAHLDFAQLTVWNADLRHANLQQVNFAHADLTHSIFMESFSGVLRLAYSPDGNVLASATTDGNIYFWNTQNYQLIGIAPGNGRWVWSLAFSPDGQYLASGSADRQLRLWNLSTMQIAPGDAVQTLKAQTVLTGHTDAIFALAFTPDGQQLASGSADQTIRLWDVTTGSLTAILHSHQGAIYTLAFDQTGATLASAGRDRVVKLWDMATQSVRHNCVAHTGDIIALLFHARGGTTSDWLITASRDHTVRIWTLDNGQLHTTLTDANNEMLTLATSPSRNLLTGAGADQVIHFWDLTTLQPCYALSGHEDSVRTLAFSPDGITLASGGSDQTIRLWDTEKGRAVYRIQGYKNAISALALSPDGKLLANGNINHLLHLWALTPAQAQPPQIHQTLQGHHSAIRAMAFHPHHPLLVSGSDDGDLRLWTLASEVGEGLRSLHGHKGAVTAVAFCPDGRWLATGSADSAVRLWDVEHSVCTHVLRNHTKMVNAVSFSPDGRYLASVDDDGMVLLYELDRLVQKGSGAVTAIPLSRAMNRSPLFALAFSPDSKMLVVGGAEKELQRWSVDEERWLASWSGHSSSIYALAFSPDGHYLASGGGDHQIYLWSIATETPAFIWPGHKGLVLALLFNPTSEVLFSSSADQTIGVWPVNAGNVQPTFLQPPSPYMAMNIGDATGLTGAKRAVLKTLGAVASTPLAPSAS